MEIKDVQPNQGNLDLVLTITEKGEVRTFEKFSKQGRVCTAKAEDETGEIKLTLWNEDIEKVNPGDKIHLKNGWCSEYQGEKQLSTGKFGEIEVIEAAKTLTEPEPEPPLPEKEGQELLESEEPIQEEETIE